jgi:hypothetical protein
MHRVAALLLALLAACQQPVKEPSVAGHFYPAQPEALREMLRGFLQAAHPPAPKGHLVALISPHAGYIYSGGVAAWGYKLLEDKDIQTVLLLGPAHRWGKRGISIWPKGVFRTPLGELKVDSRLAKTLLSPEKGVDFYPQAFRGEHSLEVQLPLLQTVLQGEFKIVPILLGTPTREGFQHLREALTRALQDRDDALLIISTDLSHYHPYDKAVEIDQRFLQALRRLDTAGLQHLLSQRRAEACGAWAVLLGLEVSRALGANKAEVLKYANSGDTAGGRDRVVGYASVALLREPLSAQEERQLLTLAYQSIRGYILNGTIPPAKIRNPKFLATQATFVTITKGGRLRGCIGDVLPSRALYQSVQQNAVAAATRDPRFPPLSKEELQHIELEISILSPLKPLRQPRDVQVGRDGLYLVKGRHRGLLLPQVPLQLGWSKEEFLQQLCLKAGITEPLNQCLQNAQLYRFQTYTIKGQHFP